MSNSIPRRKFCNICGKEFDDLDYCFRVNQKELFVGFGSRHDEERYEFNLCIDCFDKVLDELLNRCRISPLVDDSYIDHATDLRCHIHSIWGPGRTVSANRMRFVEDIPPEDYRNMICFIMNREFDSVEYMTRDGKYVAITVFNRKNQNREIFFEKLAECHVPSDFFSETLDDGYEIFIKSDLRGWYEAKKAKKAKMRIPALILKKWNTASEWLEEVSIGLENGFNN